MSAKKETSPATRLVPAEDAGAAQPGSELNDEQVRAYLMDNSDFLQRHPDMLDHLHIGHASGSAVSLVEKQVSVLRERNIDMRHRLKTLTSNARANDKLHQQTSELVLNLLETDSIAALYRTFMESMHKGFKLDYASMILFGDDQLETDARVDSLDTAKKAIGALLRGHKPLCGALRTEELAYLFANTAAGTIGPQAGSAALMPLTWGSKQLGLIAVGSSDPNYYSSSIDTLFLAHIGDVIVRLLPRLQLLDDAPPGEA